MFKKITLLLAIVVTLLGACALRGGNSNNNSNDNNVDYDNNSTPVGWVLIGEQNFASTEVAFPILRFYNHIPYVAFLDTSSGGSGALVKVMKYVAAADTWQDVGESSYAVASSNLAFEISSTGELYVAYSSGITTPIGKIAVQKFDGVSWLSIGSTPITSIKAVEHVALTLKGETTPYVAYYDIDSGKVIIKKYTAGAWSSGTVGLAAEADYVALASDSNSVYFATVSAVDGLVGLKKYTGGTDVETVITSPSTHQFKDTSIIVSGNYLYFTGVDIGSVYKVFLKRYNTAVPAWSQLGTSEYVSDGSAGAPSIFSQTGGVSNDVTYIAYRDSSASDHASVKFCMDDAAIVCTNLGGLGLSDTTIIDISLSYDNGHPYVAYVNTTTNGLEVRKY